MERMDTNRAGDYVLNEMPVVPIRFLLLIIAVISVSGCTKPWGVRDPWGILDSADLVRKVQKEDAAKSKAKLAADLRSSFCATPNGRKAVADEAAKSLTDDIEPCPDSLTN